MQLRCSVEEPGDENDWLAVFEEFGRGGVFKAEPDFPVALAFFRDALVRAHASTDPPFDPPAEFQPSHPSRSQRLLNWRDRYRFPEIDAGFVWLGEMLERVTEGIPSVTEVEFREPAGWYATNESRLRASAGSEGSLDLGGGRRIWYSNIRYDLAKGPRADGAGKIADDVRQLRRRYGS